MINLFRPFVPDLPELDDILHSNQLASGAYSIKFEEQVGSFLGNQYILATNQYSNAIYVTLRALGINPGDEVIMSPLACLMSTQPYAAYGLKIKWCDIDRTTGTIDVDSLKACISNKTKLIVHYHFCGYVGHVEEVNEIAGENSILVIDDGIECFGSEYKDKKIGNCGSDATIFSCAAVRIPNTIDGGIISFKNKEVYEKAIIIRDLGIDRKRFRKANGEIDENCDISDVGYSATMSNVNGYIGCEQMKHIDSLLEKQRHNADIIKDKLEGNKDVSLIGNSVSNPNYWVFGLLVSDKDKYIEYFSKKGFKASSVHVDNSAYSVFGNQRSGLKNVEWFANHFLAIPSGWFVDSESYDTLDDK